MARTPSIRYVSWREGRPRFQPPARLRAMGFAGRDLRHEDGRWFTAGEALDWSNDFCATLDAPRKPRAMPAVARASAGYSIRMLFEDWFRSPRFVGEGHQKPYAPASIRDYRQKARVIETHDADLYDAQVAALDETIVYGLYEALWQSRGLATARGAVVTLSAAIAWARKRGRLPAGFVNPCRNLGLQAPAPRVRAAEPAEIAALVAAADALGRADMGDMIVLGIWSGQRQGDRMALQSALVDGRRRFVQAKRGAIVHVREAPELTARLDAAAARRRAAGIVSPFVVLDETAWQPWKADTYRHVFARVRDLAVKGSARHGLAPCRSLEGFRDQDLRDTAVTWLSRAGCEIPEICAITGHSLASATSVLRHYLAPHPELADNGMAKMTAWFTSANSA